MQPAGHIVAHVPDAERTETAVADLAVHGVHAEVVHAEPGTYRVQDESLHEHIQSGERGLATGLGIGAVVGLVIVLVVGSLTDLGWLPRLILVAGIAVQGTVPAIMWRMGRIEHFDDDPERTLTLSAEDQLLVVDVPSEARRARQVLDDHEAVHLTDRHPEEVSA